MPALFLIEGLIMKVTFQDFYGQYITIHNETCSGNIRLKVSTMKSLNDLSTEDKCDLTTDISLTENHLDILIGALQEMRNKL